MGRDPRESEGERVRIEKRPKRAEQSNEIRNCFFLRFPPLFFRNSIDKALSLSHLLRSQDKEKHTKSAEEETTETRRTKNSEEEEKRTVSLSLSLSLSLPFGSVAIRFSREIRFVIFFLFHFR